MRKKRMTQEEFNEAMNKKWDMLQQVLEDKEMTSTAIAVYAVIWKYHRIDYNYAYPTRKQLCELAHVSIPTLDRALKLLVETGHIEIKSGKKSGRNSLYYLLNKPVVKEEEEEMFDEAPEDYWMV